MIVDLSSVLAGPSVATFFAELGARVIRFEKPGGDVTRGWKLPTEDADAPVSAYYASVNYGKEIHTVDMRNSDDRRRIFDLLAEADVLIQNYKTRDLERFELNPDALRKRFPKLIHCHLRGFKDDPHRVAFDVVLQAETGWLSMNGTPDSGPVKMPVAMMDVLAAHQMKEAILQALYLRECDGKGAFIDASLEEAGIAALTNQGSNYLMAKHIPERIGMQHPNIAPYGDTFSCSDAKEVVLAVGSDAQFQKLCRFLDAAKAADDDNFATNAARVKNRRALINMLSLHIAQVTSVDLLAFCHKEQVPAGAVKNLEEVSETSAAQSMVREEEIEGTPTRRFTGVGYRMQR